LGILTTYFSDTFVSSYTCGSAVHVIKSQLKDLLGISNSIRYTGLFNIPKVGDHLNFSLKLLICFEFLNLKVHSRLGN